MKFGYVRVSTKEQNEQRQVELMQQQGIDPQHIYIEKESGLKKSRPIYELMKSHLRRDDILYLDELSRLGRNYNDIINEWRDITRRINSDIIVLDNELFNTLKFKELGEIGRFLEDTVLNTLAYVYSQEIRSSKRRQAEGIALAKKKGVYKGRKPIELDMKLFKTLYQNVLEGKMSIVSMARALGISESTCHRRIKNYRK